MGVKLISAEEQLAPFGGMGQKRNDLGGQRLDCFEGRPGDASSVYISAHDFCGEQDHNAQNDQRQTHQHPKFVGIHNPCAMEECGKMARGVLHGFS